MIYWNVCNSAVATQEVSTLSMNVHNWKHLIIFKGVETPPFLRDPGFWGLTIFNNYPTESVGVLKQCSRKFKAWFFFNWHLFVFAVGSWSRNQLLRFTPSNIHFIPLAVLSPAGIVELPLCFLCLQVLAVSIPSWSLPTTRSLRGSLRVGMAAVFISVTGPSVSVFLSR